MPNPSAAQLEGGLLDPFIPPEAARRKLAAWKGLGLGAAVLTPSLLAEVASAAADMKLVGAVGFPSGAATLTSKRVELLEVVRLGGQGAEVVLTPYLVAEGHMGGLEKEMKELLKTAPELELRFAVEWERLALAPRTKLLRLLRDFPPAALRISLGPYSPPLSDAAVTLLKPQLPKKVLLKAVAASPEAAEGLLAAGADLVECDRPERAVGGAG